MEVNLPPVRMQRCGTQTMYPCVAFPRARPLLLVSRKFLMPFSVQFLSDT